MTSQFPAWIVIGPSVVAAEFAAIGPFAWLYWHHSQRLENAELPLAFLIGPVAKQGLRLWHQFGPNLALGTIVVAVAARKPVVLAVEQFHIPAATHQ